MRYIVAIDGSEVSKKAVEKAVEYAKERNAELEIVYVARRKTIETSNGEKILESEDDAQQKGKEILRQGEEWVDEGIEVETTLLWGKPGEKIPKYAEKEESEAIFVGHRSLKDKYEKRVGSVAKSIIGQTSLPVMVVGKSNV